MSATVTPQPEDDTMPVRVAGLFGAGRISLDTAVAATTTPLNIAPLLVPSAVASLIFVVAFIVLAVHTRDAAASLAAIPSAIVGINTARAAARERRRYAAELAAHNAAVAEVREALRSLNSASQETSR